MNVLYTFIINLYRESVKKLPLLKYSWLIIVTICISAFIGLLKLKSTDVFLYSFVVLIICFFCFLFSYLLTSENKFPRALINILLSAIVLFMVATIFLFASYMICQKPSFFDRWFQDKKTDILPHPDTTSPKKIVRDSIVPSQPKVVKHTNDTKILKPKINWYIIDGNIEDDRNNYLDGVKVDALGKSTISSNGYYKLELSDNPRNQINITYTKAGYISTRRYATIDVSKDTSRITQDIILKQDTHE